MSPDQEHRLEEIFSAARDLPPRERAVFLERACGGDAELRRQADSLLAAHEQARHTIMSTPEPILIGYFPKRIALPSTPAIPSHVVQLCNAGHCDGLAPKDRLDAWCHNDLCLYDSEALAWSVVPASERDAFEIHAYRLFPVLFVEGRSQPVQPPPLRVDALPPNWERLGYDAVSHPYLTTERTDILKSFGHSSLSPFCNGRCHDIPVNPFCLLGTVEDGFRRAQEFSAGGGEPEPYVVVEVWRKRSEGL